MSDVALPIATVVGPQRILRTVFEWCLLGLLTAVLGSLLVLAMLVSGCSLEFALGVLLGNLTRRRTSSQGEPENARALRLGCALRQRLGLDALARYRAAKQQAAIQQRAAVRARLERRRQDQKLHRAEIARRMRYKLRQTLLWLFALIGALATTAALVVAFIGKH